MLREDHLHDIGRPPVCGQILIAIERDELPSQLLDMSDLIETRSKRLEQAHRVGKMANGIEVKTLCFRHDGLEVIASEERVGFDEVEPIPGLRAHGG